MDDWWSGWYPWDCYDSLEHHVKYTLKYKRFYPFFVFLLMLYCLPFKIINICKKSFIIGLTLPPFLKNVRTLFIHQWGSFAIYDCGLRCFALVGILLKDKHDEKIMLLVMFVGCIYLCWINTLKINLFVSIHMKQHPTHGLQKEGEAKGLSGLQKLKREGFPKNGTFSWHLSWSIRPPPPRPPAPSNATFFHLFFAWLY